MWAKFRANTAMPADYRLFFILVKVDCAHDAGGFTTAASDAFLRVKQNAAALPKGKRARNTHLRAVRLAAGTTDQRDKLAGKTAPRTDMYAALPDRMVLSVKRGAYNHAGKASYAFTHFFCLNNFCQIYNPPF